MRQVSTNDVFLIAAVFSIIVALSIGVSAAPTSRHALSQPERASACWCHAYAFVPPPSLGHDPRRPVALVDQLLSKVDQALTGSCTYSSEAVTVVLMHIERHVLV